MTSVRTYRRHLWLWFADGSSVRVWVDDLRVWRRRGGAK